MAEDLMNFSELENSENMCPDEDDEKAPSLLQPPVIVNSILKQSTKDNLIQLCTPVMKPKNLKVHFTPRCGQTPTVPASKTKRSKTRFNLSGLHAPAAETLAIVQGAGQQDGPDGPDSAVDSAVEEQEDLEAWIDRTSVLTKQDHADYTLYAREILLDIINSRVITDELNGSQSSSDSGVEISVTEASEETAPVEAPSSSLQDTAPADAQEGSAPSTEVTADSGVTTDSQATPASTLDLDEPDRIASDLLKSLDALISGSLGMETSVDPDQPAEESAAVSTVEVTPAVEPVQEHMECEEEAMDVDDDLLAPVVPENVTCISGINTENASTDTMHQATVNRASNNEETLHMDSAQQLPVEVKKEQGSVESADRERPRLPESGNTSGDEEFMSADEDMEVDVDDEPQPAVQSDLVSQNTAQQPQSVPTDIAIKPSHPSTTDTTIQPSHLSATEQPFLPTTDSTEQPSQAVPTENTEQPSQAVPNNNTEQPVTTEQPSKPVPTDITHPSHPEESPVKPVMDEAVVSESPERIPPKVGYSLNFDNLEGVDPFQTGSKIVNTPDRQKGSDGLAVSGQKTEAVCKTREPPASDNKEKSDSKEEIEDVKEEFKSAASSPVKPDTDPGPVEEADTLPSQGEVREKETEIKLVVDAPQKLDEQDPFRTKTKVMNSPEMKACTSVPLDEQDPFKPKTQIMNSPDPKAPEKEVTDEPDPFKPKTQIMNSPDAKAPVKEVLDEIDPFKPKSQIVNSPETKAHATEVLDEPDPFKPKVQIVNSPDTKATATHISDEPDPFKPKTQIMNSPDTKAPVKEVLDEADPFKPKSQIVNSLDTKATAQTLDEPDPFKPKAQILNSPDAKAPVNELLDEPDPFKPKAQIMNSPDVKAPASGQTDEPDPFKPKKQVMNSPDVKLGSSLQLTESEVPIQPAENKSASETVAESATSSDVISCEETPLSKAGVQQDVGSEKCSDTSAAVQEPELLEAEPKRGAYDLDDLDSMDPFQPKKQMVNSPQLKSAGSYSLNFDDLDSMDPFKPKVQMANSPKPCNATETKKVESGDAVENGAVSSNEGVAMSSTAMSEKAVNDTLMADTSEVSVAGNSCMPAETAADSDGIADVQLPAVQQDTKTKPVCEGESDVADADPFKSKKQLANSPAQPVKPAPAASLAEDLFDDLDPFKPKKQMMNSPPSNAAGSKAGETDVFGDIDPFKSKTQLTNSPKSENKGTGVSENVDDPFQTKSQIVNSPLPKEESKAVDGENGLESINPFQAKSQIANSPAQVDTGKNSFTARSKLSFDQMTTEKADPMDDFEVFSNGQSAGAMFDRDAEDTGDDLDAVCTVEGVMRKGDKPDRSGAAADQGFDVDESQFVSASQVFSDPGVWEMLEQFGNTASSNSAADSALSRMSLYVKFDPLVEDRNTISNPRRISIRPKQLEKVKEYGIDDTLLLLGTPPKKSRQSMGPRQSIGHRQSMGFRHAPPQMGGVDMILSISPEQKASKEQSSREPGTGIQMSSVLDETESCPGLVEELKYTEGQVRELRRQMKLEFQGVLMTKEKELCKQLDKKEQQLQAVIEKHRNKEKQYSEMVFLVEMYTNTITEMKSEKDDAKEKYSQVLKEKEQALQDIQEVETAFSDLHRRYEKLKSVVKGLKENEDSLKKFASEVQDKHKEVDKKLSAKQKTTEEKLQRVIQENEKLKHQLESEKAKSEAQLRVKEMANERLQKSLDQKVEENKQLTDICDNLLQKVG